MLLRSEEYMDEEKKIRIITEYYGKYDENGNEIVTATVEETFSTEEVESESVEPEPTQLDRIESMVAKSQEQIAQEARDAYTLELIEGGVIA